MWGFSLLMQKPGWSTHSLSCALGMVLWLGSWTANEPAGCKDRPCLVLSVSAPRSWWVYEIISERERTKKTRYTRIIGLTVSILGDPASRGGFTEVHHAVVMLTRAAQGVLPSHTGRVVPSAPQQLRGNTAEPMAWVCWAGGLSDGGKPLKISHWAQLCQMLCFPSQRK